MTLGDLVRRLASQEAENDVGERWGKRCLAYAMDCTSQFLVLGSRTRVRLPSVRDEVVDSEMTSLVSKLASPRSTQQIAQHRRDVVGRSLGIDPIDGSRDSEERDLREVLREIERKPATEVREERRTQAFEQPLERLFIAALR